MGGDAANYGTYVVEAVATGPAHLVQDFVEAFGEGLDVVVVAEDCDGCGAQFGTVVERRAPVVFLGKALQGEEGQVYQRLVCQLLIAALENL